VSILLNKIQLKRSLNMNYKLRAISILFIVFLFLTNMNAQISDKITLNGYSSFEYEKQFGDEGKGDPNGSFDADLFDLVINVFATERLRIAADITWEHGAASEDDRGNVAIEYAFAQYTINDLFKIRAGKVFVPFGIYNEIHTAKPAFLTVKEPLSTNKNHKFGSDVRFYPRWATGFSFLGNYNLGNMDGDYILLLSNGEQENTNPFEEDDNKEKSLAGRFRINPLENLRVGFSFYNDQLTELDTTGEDSGDRTSLFSFGGQAEGNYGDLGLELEYIAGDVKPSVGSSISRYGYTAMLSYNYLDTYTPYVRYEFLDPNTDLEKDQASQLIYGINIMIDEGLFLKVELNNVSSEDANDRFKGKDYTELKGAIAIGF
jgi:hypothetical protein